MKIYSSEIYFVTYFVIKCETEKLTFIALCIKNNNNNKKKGQHCNLGSKMQFNALKSVFDILHLLLMLYFLVLE